MSREKKTIQFTVLGTTAEYDKVFEEIKQLPKTLPPEEIVSQIQKKISLAMIWALPLEMKAIKSFPIHRIRVQKQDEVINEEGISSFYYPPDTTKIKMGRANVAGQQVFYASGDNHTPFHELSDQIEVGKSIVYFTQWGIRDCFEVVNMRTLFMGISTNEENDYASIMAKGLNEQIEEFLFSWKLDEKPRELFRYCQQHYNDLFTVNGNECYHISSAIAHDTFVSALNQNVDIPIIAYPAVSKDKRAVNFAFRKDFADKYIYLKQIDKVVVTKLEDESVGFTPISRGIVKDGKLEWHKLKVKAEPDYENAWVCFDKIARPLQPGEGVTSCCAKHKISIEEFLRRNSLSEETLVQGITELPKELMDGQLSKVEKREIIASTYGDVFVESDTSEAGRVKYIRLPVDYTIGYESN